MSDGKTHDELTQYISIGTPILVSLVYILAADFRVGIMAFITFLGCQAQRYCTPDVDVNVGYYGLYIAKRDFGYYLGNILEIILYPLRAIKHRHWLSHGFLIGTLFRLSYLYFVYYLITRLAPEYFIYITVNNLEYFLVFFIGFFVADLGHLFLDYIWRF